MTKTWPLQDAIILIAEADYNTLSGQDCSFVDYLLSGPKAELDIPRPADFGRALDL